MRIHADPDPQPCLLRSNNWIFQFHTVRKNRNKYTVNNLRSFTCFISVADPHGQMQIRIEKVQKPRKCTGSYGQYRTGRSKVRILLYYLNFNTFLLGPYEHFRDPRSESEFLTPGKWSLTQSWIRNILKVSKQWLYTRLGQIFRMEKNRLW